MVTDLDGTLIRTDAGMLAVRRLARRRPMALAAALSSLPLRGLAHFKRRVAEHITLNAAALPYDPAFLAFLRAAHAAGRTLHLATASDAKHAQAVAGHLEGLFTEVHASDGHINLKGARKAALLVARYGRHGFDYAGDSRADLEVWPHARRAILVNVSRTVERRLRLPAADIEVFSRR